MARDASNASGRGVCAKLAVCSALLLLLLLLVAAPTRAFDSNKVYRYELEGTISTKVADDAKPQYSGVAFSSPLLLKKSGQDELTIKLERGQLATFNQLSDTDRPQAKPDSFKPVEASAGLDKAFRIYFEEGSVKSFDTYKEEPKWVTNFKRGLLSLFQLKLNSSQYFSTSEKSVFGECDTDYLIVSSEPERLNVTKTRNLATCKTRFQHRFMPIDSSECQDGERDLQHKHSNAIFHYQLLGNRQSYVIERVQLEEESVFSPFGQGAHTHLVASSFQLRLAKVEEGGGLSLDEGATRIESLSYDPPEMVNFYANINLEAAHHLSNIYQTSASVDQLMAAFEALVQEHRLYTAAFEGQQQQQVGEPSYQESSRLAELFMRLNELMGTMSLSKIEQVYSQVDERGEAYKKIFWDLMSVVGTNPSFSFMKKLIIEGDAPSVKIKDFLTRLSYHIKMPSKSLFDEYVNLCKSDKIQTEQQYKRLCSLPLASLIHQHCAKPHTKYLRQQQEGANATSYKKGQNTCQIATAEEYFSRLVQPFALQAYAGSYGAQASQTSQAAGGGGGGQSGGQSPSDAELSVGDKMFNIKMAGELGVRPSIDFLMEVVNFRDEHPSLRAAAMWNLQKAARIYPSQVKKLVVPVYYDQSEQLEVRLAAFYNWHYASMSLHEMELLAEQLQTEPSRQLVLYIHSYFKSLAELSPMPCVAANVRNARQVLPAIKRALRRHARPSLLDSSASMQSSWLPDFGYGTASITSLIFSNESSSLTNLQYSSSEIMSGLRFSAMQVTVQLHGADKLLKRVAGIGGLLADKDSFMDVFSLKRRSRRQVAAELIKQEAAEIERELKLSTRDFSDVYVAVTISAYGRPVTFFDRDSRELKKMLSDDGTIKIPQIKKLLHSFNNHTTQQMMINFEKLEVFNNELGLPLYQSISDFDYKTFKLNSVKLDVEPGFFKDERQGKPPSKIAAALDAKLSRHNEMFISTGALLVHNKQQVGVGFYKKKLISVPIKMSLEADLLNSRISIKRQPIHENLLSIKQYPVTFVKSYEPASSSSSKPNDTNEWRQLYDFKDPSQVKQFKLDYMTPLAVGLKLEGKHKLGQDWSMAAWRRHLASVGLSAAKFMYYYSPTGAPLELRLSTVTSEENPTRELVSQLSWRHYHEEQPADMDEVDRELEKATGGGGTAGEPRPSTVHYRLALVGGSSKERKVSLDLGYSRSWDRLAHKWRLFYQRTPLDQAQPNAETTNLCWLGEARFPRYQPSKLLNLELLGSAGQEHTVNLSSELTFGDHCSEAKLEQAPARLSAKVTFDWTQEQRGQIEQALGGSQLSEEQLKRNPYAVAHRACLRARERNGNKLDAACVQLLERLTELTHANATLDYKDVPERWTKLVKRLGSLYTYARAGYIEELEDRAYRPAGEYRSADGQRERAYLEANMTQVGASERKLSYDFETPNYHVLYRNLPISVPPLSTFPLLGSSLYQRLQGRDSEQTCSLSGQQVTTFDQLTYSMPSVGDGCLALLAKDCSPENNFVVLAAKAGQARVLKVYLAERFKVEFVPDKEGERVSDIKVNGETVSVEPEAKSPLRRHMKLGQGAKQVEAFAIHNNGAYYTLHSSHFRFSVITDGKWILIKQSKYYAGKSCGLCGDANGDQQLEFKSPSSTWRVCRNSTDFVWAHVLPSTCASRPASIECA